MVRPFVLILTLMGCGESPSKQADTSHDSHDTGVPTSSTSTTRPAADASLFMLELSATEADWRDLAYLAAIPASAHLNQGAPAVVAVVDYDDRGTATRDLLQRLVPKNGYIMDDGETIPQAETSTGLVAEDAESWSRLLAQTFWTTSDYAVVVSLDDYAGALFGASLAARLDAPLLFASLSSAVEVDALVGALGAEALVIGVDDDPLPLPSDPTLLAGLDVALDWVRNEDLEVSYLTVSNPLDRYSGRSQKASLVAPMYAARRRGLSVPVSLAMPTRVVADGGDHPVLPALADVYEQLGGPPEHLAIVGAHDALPQMRKPTIFDNPLEEQPVSDLPYGEIDEDPFLDLAIGRLVGDTVEELSVIATRTSMYENLMDGTWERNFVESGLWGFDELRSITLNVGFEAPQHLSQGEIDASRSLEIGAFLHKDHSYCQVLGNAVDVDTTTLFSPAVVVSRGCSVGGMDLLSDSQRSIVDHMFGRGVVAFVGASRNAIAYNTLIEVSLWNQLVDGRTLGQSFRHGVNDAIVHWLDDGSTAMRYAIDTEIVYGDPAFRMHIPSNYLTSPAGQSFDGATLTVTAPETWTRVQYHPEMLAEWSYDGDLYMYTAPGASPRTYWAGLYDLEDMYFGVQLPLAQPPASVQALDTHPAPLGWPETYHLDGHVDGTTTALWRVRLLDFNEHTGAIVTDAAAFEYAVD